MYPSWLDYVNEKRHKNLVNILQELSKLQSQANLNFIIIGALPLLIRDYLHYLVYWDVDLLFRDEETLREFIKMPKTRSLRIVNYDDNLMVNKNITSFHTAWSFNQTWFNVDYILKKAIFEFYTENISKLEPYIQKIKLNSEIYYIHLYIAHPWDVITEKVLSPRTEKDLSLKIDMSVDIRHIFAVYRKEKDNIQFWNHILKRADFLQKRKKFTENFLSLLSHANELGYSDLEITPLSMEILKTEYPNDTNENE